MFHIILYQPEIPPNTGNIMRLATNTGSTLSLVRPLGFTLEDTKLKRAGLDYSDWVNVKAYDTLDECLSSVAKDRIFAFSTKGALRLDEVNFQQGDTFIFGPETRGLPVDVRNRFMETCVRIPMRPQSRSLNLSNAVSVAVFEAWRQQNFAGAK
ncbi:MAG: tRNA (cytidine(34)-2'-O)-methyltransferase [Gammaproteobacteria bacterium]|nr:tRNA (cytidine(34)-2'-O)-methyltransferase [Gammaproteobacteria bacterium]MYF37760.1 tRNA (cytidine(34)-2'-O)-methyltransferase [Gammaproteobacteria bacterium]